MHVAVDLHPEKLRGERQARTAVPVLASGALNPERTLLVFVKADRNAEVSRTGLNRVNRLSQCGSAGRAAVHNVGEGQAGQADPTYHGVGGTAVH